MREVFDIMVDRLDGYLETLDGIWNDELLAVNDRLEALGMAPLDPWDPDTPIWAPEGM